MRDEISVKILIIIKLILNMEANHLLSSFDMKGFENRVIFIIKEAPIYTYLTKPNYR